MGTSKCDALILTRNEAQELADLAESALDGDRAFTEPDECDYCRAFRFRDWDTVGRLQEERGGPDKACRCDS